MSGKESVHGVIFQINDLEGFVKLEKYLSKLLDIRRQQDLDARNFKPDFWAPIATAYRPFEMRINELSLVGEVESEQIDELKQMALGAVKLLWNAKEGMLFNKEVLTAEKLKAAIKGEVEMPEGGVDGKAKVLEGKFRG